MGLLPTVFLILVLVIGVQSQCNVVRLVPNSASLTVTESVSKPLSIIRCSNNGSSTTDVLAESFTCRILQILDSVTSTTSVNNNLFTVLREVNAVLLNTVGEWLVVFNSDNSANLQRIIGTQYRILLGCSDAQVNTVTNSNQQAVLVVTITPNLEPIIFNAPGAIINLNAKETGKDQLLYNVVVNDPENDFITYSLSTIPTVDYFVMDTSNGEIRTAVDLKKATVSNIFLNVNVSDGLNTVGPFMITVRLNNLNTRPDITNLPTSIEIREDAVGGFLVSSMTVVDPDIFTDLSSLTPNCSVSPLSGSAKFNQRDSKIFLTGQTPEQSIFDFEDTRNFVITCSITDGFLSSENETILVNISNVNEPPVFNERIYYCNLFESTAGGSTCDLGMTLRDPESNPFSLLLLPGNNSERFALQRSSQQFFSANDQQLTFNIDYDLDTGQLPSNVVVTIAAVDSIGATGTAAISISVVDVNDNSPVFSEQLSAITVDYNTQLGIVGAITATDQDRGSNGQVDYKLIEVIPFNYISFVSALANGEIHYARQYPDNVAGTSAFLVIRATDRGSPRRSSTGTVAVSFIATTTTSTTTSSTSPTTTTMTTTVATTTTTEYNFFAHTENVVMLTALLLALLVAAAILLFLCTRYSTLGYCCFPNPDPADDYAYDSRQGTPYDGYRGKQDLYDRDYGRREVGAGGRSLPMVKY